MSFEACLIETVYFIRWIAPQASDHAQLKGAVERMARDHGRLRAIISIVPHDLPVPDAEARRAGAEWMRWASPWADVFIVVVEGRGLKYTVMRAFAAAMAAVAGTRDCSFAEASVAAALARLQPPLAVTPAEISAQLKAWEMPP